MAGSVQWRILGELKKVNTRLDVVENQVAEMTAPGRRTRSTSTGLKTVSKYNKQYDSLSSDSTDGSDQEVILPDLTHIRSSKSIQWQIDQSIARLGKSK